MRTSALAVAFLTLSLGSSFSPLCAEPVIAPGPKVDHHEHFLSPDLAPVMARGEELAFEPVRLPPDMAQALNRRATAWNDADALARLFSDHALFVQVADQTLLLQDSVIAGRSAIADYLAKRVFARQYLITPVAYSQDGPTRHVTALFARPQPRGDAADYRHIALAHFSYIKGRRGGWLIASETVKFPGPPTYTPIDADALVKLLDEARVERAVVLSGAYIFESPLMPALSDASARLRAENSWTAEQAARHPTRLVAFCGVNPLTDTALPEIERCHSELGMKGLKLHLGNSGVDLQRPEHVARLRQVFETANRLKLPIVVHVATGDMSSAPKNAQVFLDSILPSAPDVVVQVAHLTGSGPGWNDQALQVFAAAMEKRDPRTRKLYFDVATVADLQKSDRLELLARQIRQIGPDRVLFGSDGAFGGRKTPAQEWGTFRGMVPLTDAEFATIRDNVAPYLK